MQDFWVGQSALKAAPPSQEQAFWLVAVALPIAAPPTDVGLAPFLLAVAELVVVGEEQVWRVGFVKLGFDEQYFGLSSLDLPTLDEQSFALLEFDEPHFAKREAELAIAQSCVDVQPDFAEQAFSERIALVIILLGQGDFLSSHFGAWYDFLATLMERTAGRIWLFDEQGRAEQLP